MNRLIKGIESKKELTGKLWGNRSVKKVGTKQKESYSPSPRLVLTRIKVMLKLCGLSLRHKAPCSKSFLQKTVTD